MTLRRYIIATMVLAGAVVAQAQVQLRSYETIFGRAKLVKNACHHGAKYNQVDRNNIRLVAENLLRFQNADGGWPKGIDWLDTAPVDSILSYLPEKQKISVLDGKNVCMQLEYMSQAFTQFQDERFKTSALRSLDYLLAAQMPNGGWKGNDINAICFNSNIMSSVLKTLYLISNGMSPYQWMPRSNRSKAKKAYEKGIDVALKCQIRMPDGTLAGWCQQHDNETFLPTKGRSYEHPCISAAETAMMTSMMMSIAQPDAKIKEAVVGAMTWLESAARSGIKIVNIPASDSLQAITHKKIDRELVKDPESKRIWARCYSLDKNEIFFSDKNGTIKYDFNSVEPDRRINYAWFGYWPEGSMILYRTWKIKHNVK